MTMPFLKPRLLLAFGLIGAVLLVPSMGCAGLHVGVGERFEVTPSRLFLAPGESATISVEATEIPYQGFTYTVVEGDAGGTVVENENDNPHGATYTAPATKGTYHVRAGIVKPDGSSRLRTVTVVVR